MPSHKNLTGNDMHVVQRWTVADQSAREALTVAAEDVGKVALQLDDRTFHFLTNHSPMTWLQIGGANYLPLAGGTMTGAINFGSGGQNINRGSFTNGTGGDNGLGVTCAVGYELHWEGGRLSNYNGSVIPIVLESGLQFYDSDVKLYASDTGVTINPNTRKLEVNGHEVLSWASEDLWIKNESGVQMMNWSEGYLQINNHGSDTLVKPVGWDGTHLINTYDGSTVGSALTPWTEDVDADYHGLLNLLSLNIAPYSLTPGDPAFCISDDPGNFVAMATRSVAGNKGLQLSAQGDMEIFTENKGGTDNSGYIAIYTGSTSAGNSGDIYIETESSGSGVRGNVYLQGVAVPKGLSSGDDGKFLQYDNGTDSYVVADAGGTPAGSSGQIQFNDSGAFGSSPKLSFTGNNLTLGDSTYGGVTRLDLTSDTGPGVIIGINGSTESFPGALCLYAPHGIQTFGSRGTLGQVLSSGGDDEPRWIDPTGFQTPWNSAIDAALNPLNNAINIRFSAFNGSDWVQYTQLGATVDGNGNALLNIDDYYNEITGKICLTKRSDNSSLATGDVLMYDGTSFYPSAFSGGQTPWLSSINANVYELQNVSAITFPTSGPSGNITWGGGININTDDNTGSDDSQKIKLLTGNSGDGATGNIELVTGTPSGNGARGGLVVDVWDIDITSHNQVDFTAAGPFNISATSGDVHITSDINTYIDGLRYPHADGTAGQAIVTDGAANLSFAGVLTNPAGADIDFAGFHGIRVGAIEFDTSNLDIESSADGNSKPCFTVYDGDNDYLVNLQIIYRSDGSLRSDGDTLVYDGATNCFYAEAPGGGVTNPLSADLDCGTHYLQANSGGGATNAIYVTNRLLIDSVGETAVDWESRVLKDGGGNTIVDWLTGYIQDGGGTPILDFSRKLYNSSGSEVFDFDGNTIYDNTHGPSILPGSRYLKNWSNSVSIDWGGHSLSDASGNTVLNFYTQASGIADASYVSGTGDDTTINAFIDKFNDLLAKNRTYGLIDT